MKIANGRDFWAGVMFIGSGAFFWIASKAYPMGTAVRMGPSYFPTVLGGMLVVLGAIVFFRGFFSKIQHGWHVFPFRLNYLIGAAIVSAIAWWGAPFIADLGKPVGPYVQYAVNGVALALFMAAWGPKSLFIILAAVVAFGYLLKPWGLVFTTIMLIEVSAWGGHEYHWKEMTIWSIVLAAFSVGTFVYGLGLPMNIWPEWN